MESGRGTTGIGGGSAGTPIELELSRRGFLAGATAGALGFAGLTRLLASLADAAEALARVAALGPGDRLVRETIRAYADTIVPGPAGGADPDPGAIEAGAVEEAYDDFYGARATFPAIYIDLQAATPLILGRPTSFDLRLPYRDRERVVIERIRTTAEGGDNPLYLAYVALATLIWVAYYGTARSGKGVRYIGLPPHSDGYWPRHTHRVRFRGMGTGVTRDGNPR